MSWADTEDKRKAIEQKLKTQTSRRQMDTVTRWKEPSPQPYWQLIVDSSWIDSLGRETAQRTLDDSIEEAGLYAPINGVVLDPRPRAK